MVQLNLISALLRTLMPGKYEVIIIDVVGRPLLIAAYLMSAFFFVAPQPPWHRISYFGLAGHLSGKVGKLARG